MKKLIILSVITTSLITVACGSENENSNSIAQMMSLSTILQKEELQVRTELIAEIKTQLKVEAEIRAKLKQEIQDEIFSKIEVRISKLKAEIKAQLDLNKIDVIKLREEIKQEIKAEIANTKVTPKLVEVKQAIESLGDLSIGKLVDLATASIDNSTTDLLPKEIAKPTNTTAVFDYKLEPKQVAENVWCFFGALDKPTKENAGNMVNGCYIKTTEGYLVMDTGPSYQYAKQSYEVMQKIADLPVKYVVNSHEHDDHWLGNDFYKQKFGATLIGPESINTNYKEGDQTRMYNVLPSNAIEGTHIIDLDKIVKETFTLNFGGEEFTIIPIDVKAHTGDDVFIYMPKRKVLFAGDLVMNGRITSGRHGSVMGQLKALAIMKKLDWKVMVPGHGFITDATAMDEADLYFNLTKERILDAIDEDIDATEINEVVKLIEFKDKAMYDILNAHNIGFAYDELEMLDE